MVGAPATVIPTVEEEVTGSRNLRPNGGALRGLQSRKEELGAGVTEEGL